MYQSENFMAPPFRYTVRLAPRQEGETHNAYYLIEWGKDGPTPKESKVIGLTILIGTDDGRAFRTYGMNNCFQTIEEASEYMDGLADRWPEDGRVMIDSEMVVYQ
jgi:hypothetical protein